jgi:hypothetical protein
MLSLTWFCFYNIVKFPSILPALTFFDRHDITEILLKVALNTINPNPLLRISNAALKEYIFKTVICWRNRIIGLLYQNKGDALFNMILLTILWKTYKVKKINIYSNLTRWLCFIDKRWGLINENQRRNKPLCTMSDSK